MGHLRFVFEKAKEYGLKIILEKSQFVQLSTVYLFMAKEAIIQT